MKYALLIDDPTEAIERGYLVLYPPRLPVADLYELCLKAWEINLFPVAAFPNGLSKENLMARVKRTEAGAACETLIRLIEISSNVPDLGKLKPIVRKVTEDQPLTNEDKEILAKETDWKERIQRLVEYHEQKMVLQEEFEPQKELILGILDLTTETPIYTPANSASHSIREKSVA